MAKNFSDFQLLTGSFVDSGNDYETGVTTTQATTAMHLVGYDTELPHGERQYTVESILLAADKYHVGLENVDNQSVAYMFNDSNFTGHTSAEDLYVHGDLHVEGDQTILNTETMATSSVSVENAGTEIGLLVKQTGNDGIARFLDDEDIILDIGDGGLDNLGTIGMGIEAQPWPYMLTIVGDISCNGQMRITGPVDGRDVSQDGAKLDDIQPRADVTSINLSSVSTRLGELADTLEYSGIQVAKGFDLLEDGDNFKKVPTLSAGATPGIGDYSADKIKSVEYEADVTGDHSEDITYNLIPDGPWTGDGATTYVKITSAGQDRLASVRGVAANIHQSDDGGDITTEDVVAAYQHGYPDFWSTENESQYRSTIIPAASSAVHNIGGLDEIQPHGHANLSDVNVTNALSATGDVYLGASTSVLSADGKWHAGINLDVNAGGTWLRFIDGLLVDSKPGTGAGGNNNPF